MYLDGGRWTEAAADLEFVLKTATDRALNGSIVLGGLALTLVYEALGERQKRDRCLKAVSEALPTINVPQHTVNYWYFQSLYEMAADNPAFAVECARQALKAAWFSDAINLLAPIRNSLARALACQRQFEEARELVSKNAAAIGSKYWRIIAETLAVKAEIELHAGHEAEARKAYGILRFVLAEKKPAMIYYEQRVIDEVAGAFGDVQPTSLSDKEIESYLGSGVLSSV